MAPRSTWLNGVVDIFVTELSVLGLVVSRQHAAELIGDRVGAVAAEIGVGERAARRYFTPTRSGSWRARWP